MRTCAHPGDQEHDHEMCRDVAADAAARYLVGFAVVHGGGSHVSRSFEDGPTVVTEAVIRRWEQEIIRDYAELKRPTVIIFSFQRMAQS